MIYNLKLIPKSNLELVAVLGVSGLFGHVYCPRLYFPGSCDLTVMGFHLV